MDRKALRTLIRIAFVSSLIISLFLFSPLYIINYNVIHPFISVWLNVFARFIILWAINLLLYFYVKQNWRTTWIRIFVSLGILMVLDVFFSYLFGFFFPVKSIDIVQLFSMRIANAFVFNILIHIFINLTISREKEISILGDMTDLKFSKLEADYLLLKQQINPHFIFNALNISKSLIKKSPDDAEEYIVKLSDFIRKTFTENKKSVSLVEELSLCQNYIDLQKVRFGDTVFFHDKIAPDCLHLHLPFFSLIILAENALKHNMFTNSNPLKINIFAEDGWLSFSNNLQPKTTQHSTRIGLNNLNQRCKILTGQEIIIDKTADEFKVKLKLLDNERNNH